MTLRSSSRCYASASTKQENTESHSPKPRKRKLSTRTDKRPCKRRTVLDQSATATCAMTIASLSIFDRLPMELIILIALFLCPRDLHTLTCVSRSMAEITCPLYFRERNFAPQKSQYCISVTGDAFSALPVWRRSLCFVPKPILSCTFDGASVDAQIRCLRTMISTLPPKSAFDEINLWGDTSLDKLWDLLEVIDRAGFRTVDIDSWRVFHIYQDVGTYSKLVALENLRLNYAFLSPSVWASILSRLVIPNLRKLHIVGDVSWSSLTDFLQRHPRIREVQLRMPSGAPIPNLRTHKPTLSLPMLEVISGSLDHVFALLQILPSPPHLRTLSIEAVTNLPYRTFVDNVMRCLALCEGMFRLDIGFCPSKCQSRLISSINRHAISIRRLQSTTVRARICSLRIRVQNISDENILVCCDHWLQLLPDVPLVEVQKKQLLLDVTPTYKYYSAEVHRGHALNLKIEWKK